MERDAHGIVNACSTCHLRAAGSSSTIGWNAGRMRARASLRAFHSRGEGKRLVSLSWNFHSLDQPCPSECEQRFAQFIIDLHADSSYIIRPRFLGLEQFQPGTRDNGRMDAGDSVYGGVFNRSSILSCGVIGAFCRILQHDARSSVVMKAILVLCSLFYDTVSVDWIERRRYVGICTNILLIFRFNLIFLER